ncbi:MCE family protein [candidate division KSB1 bacterium]|nr:MCE family protein [candidate division KSB1 bacterium]
MTYKKMTYISGVIIFISAVTFLTAVLWLSGQRIISASEYRVFFKFPDVVGLRDRSQVFLRGYRVGWTKGVTFEKDGVVVRVDIKRRFRIPIDSQIEINTLNLIGEKAITITPGQSEEFLPAEGRMQGENKDVMVVAKGILMDVKRRLEEGEFDKRVNEFGSSIKTMYSLINKVDNKIDRVDVDMYNRQILELGEAARSIRVMADNADKEVNDFARQGTASMKQVEEASQKIAELSVQLNEIAMRLNKGEGSMGEFMQNKEYIQNLNTTVIELRLLIEDIKKNPGKYVSVSVF